MFCLINDIDRELSLTGRQTQVALREARGRPPQVALPRGYLHIYSTFTGNENTLPLGFQNRKLDNHASITMAHLGEGEETPLSNRGHSMGIGVQKGIQNKPGA